MSERVPAPPVHADTSQHRDKRAKVDPFPDPAWLAAPPRDRQRPTMPPASISYRSNLSSSTEWSERTDPRSGHWTNFEDSGRRDGRDVGPIGKTNVGIDAYGDHHLGRPRRSSSSSRDFAAESTMTRSVDIGANADASSKVKRRKRAVLSCTECKQRKIKCDRNVPNCGSCVRRGVAHLCRWGDERDFLPSTQTSNITPSNAALMARIAQLESQVRVLQSSTSSSVGVGDSASRPAFKSTTNSEPSSGQSTRFTHRSDPKAVPNFTSSERNASTSRRTDGDAAALHGRNSEDESEESDSVESGGEDAEEVLHALAKGTSMQKTAEVDPSNGSEHADRRSRPRVTAPGESARTELARAEVLGSRLPSSVIDGRVAGNNPAEDPTAGASSKLFLLDAISFAKEWDEGDRKTQLLSLMELLPGRDKIETVIGLYMREAEPLVNSLHPPSFFKQFERFWNEYEQLRTHTNNGAATLATIPDLQFAALIFALCEGACEYMTPAEVLASELCESRTLINAQLVLLVRASVGLLGMAQFMRRPNIWGMQAVVALRHFCFNRDYREEYMVMAVMAVKASESVGLHRLGSAIKDEERWSDERPGYVQSRVQSGWSSSSGAAANPRSAAHRWKMLKSTKLQDGLETESEGEELDPERHDLNAMWLPRGEQRRKWELRATKRFKDGSRVDRETGRKVWFAMATFDWQCAAFFDRCYYVKDEMFTTQSPQNIDDADLTDRDPVDEDDLFDTDGAGKTLLPSFRSKIQPHDMPTSNSFISIHIDFCHTVRSIADAMNHGDDSYETVMAIEIRFRNILRSLPRFFRLDGESEYDPAIHELHRQRPYLSFQRAVIHEYVHHRLLKLHRLFMSRGYRNPKYIHSTRTCIESARVVIAILSSLDQVGCRGQRYWIFKFHLFHAILAIQVDLLYLARRPVNAEIVAKRADVIAGLKMLHTRTDVEGRNPTLASSLKVIKVLREEERARRATTPHDGGESATSEAISHSSPSDRHDSSSPKSSRRPKLREWTRASESTGELADHLARRVRDTWHSIVPDKLRAEMHTEALAPGYETAASPQDRRPSPSLGREPSWRASAPPLVSDAAGGSRRPSTEYRSSIHSSDSELDDYLRLLSSYQNPHDAPGGSTFFDVLGDRVFENASIDKLSFEASAVSPLAAQTWKAGVNSAMLRGVRDLAAAGAGFDAFSTP
ncbi:hypothetical protein BCV70DRAFT_164050 [Testicularia cyperi]|uniref:Zn(2)-C6 fungal-type domain-containing protein n=1 Tax=Testicularia cyperi TaxID=1882483 RepID=A0A317XKD8_9BASI|nr:hypothetical protein BCV70DRAFT_164050 [Testicularia cyperi]